MFDFDGIHEIWQTITRNKTRSLLTAFGVFWGIFLLVVLSSTGNGFENGLMMQVEGVTPNTVFFYTSVTSEPYKGYQKGRSWSMQMADIEAIREAFPYVKAISPEASVWSSEDKNVVYNSRGGSFSVKGVMPEYNEIEKSKIMRDVSSTIPTSPPTARCAFWAKKCMKPCLRKAKTRLVRW